MAVGKKEISIVIPALNVQTIKVKIVGDTSLISHRWSEKAIKMIQDKQAKKAQKGREIRDPQAEYEESYYKDEKGRICVPARNVKQCIVGSARFIDGVQMTILRGSIFVKGEGPDSLIPLVYESESMRTDMVKVGMGTADIRYRGELKGWSAEVEIDYNADVLSAEQVVSLLNLAGFSQGLMEWRAEKNGDNGKFHVSVE